MAERLRLEIWLPVPAYEGLYDISDCGRVLSFPRKGGNNRWYGGGLLGARPDSHGYHRVSLSAGGVVTDKRVHELVAEVFIGAKPEWADCVRHLDDIPAHNWIDNLAYGTDSDNAYDKVRNGNHPYAARVFCKKRGHLITGVQSRGYGRRCDECKKINDHKAYLRSKELQNV